MIRITNHDEKKVVVLLLFLLELRADIASGFLNADERTARYACRVEVRISLRVQGSYSY